MKDKEKNMHTVLLKNGIKEAEPLVRVMMYLVLPDLLKNHPTAFYDLVMRCRDKSYKFFGNNEKLLKDKNIVDTDGSIHSSIKNIVLCAIEGEGIEMRLVNPLKKSENYEGSSPNG